MCPEPTLDEKGEYSSVGCFVEDGGGPPGAGLQEQASNRHELHWSRAIVVNVDGKGGAGLRQVRFDFSGKGQYLPGSESIKEFVF